MAKTNFYKQCTMRRNGAIITAWIPVKFAKKDKFLRLKEQGKWENGWKVEKVHDVALPESAVIAHRDSYRDTRVTTDI